MTVRVIPPLTYKRSINGPSDGSILFIVGLVSMTQSDVFAILVYIISTNPIRRDQNEEVRLSLSL